MVRRQTRMGPRTGIPQRIPKGKNGDELGKNRSHTTRFKNRNRMKGRQNPKSSSAEPETEAQGALNPRTEDRKADGRQPPTIVGTYGPGYAPK